MKHFISTILPTMLLCMFGAKAYAYDIEVKNADGVTIYYNYINNEKELEVTYLYYYEDYGGILEFHIDEDEKEKLNGIGKFIIKRNDDDKILYSKLHKRILPKILDIKHSIDLL